VRGVTGWAIMTSTPHWWTWPSATRRGGIRHYAPEPRNGCTLRSQAVSRHCPSRLGSGTSIGGEYTAAEARLAQALAVFRELDTRWQSGRTLFDLGELAVAQGNFAAARDHFSGALAAFTAMGAARMRRTPVQHWQDCSKWSERLLVLRHVPACMETQWPRGAVCHEHSS